jgi:hypothetical protein
MNIPSIHHASTPRGTKWGGGGEETNTLLILAHTNIPRISQPPLPQKHPFCLEIESRMAIWHQNLIYIAIARRLLPRDSSPKAKFTTKLPPKRTGHRSAQLPPLELACIRFLSPWVRPSAWRERGRGVPGMAWAIPELGVGGRFLVSLVPGKAFPSACPGDIAWRAGSAQLSSRCIEDPSSISLVWRAFTRHAMTSRALAVDLDS